ncbi:lytic transglycosylase domain-containing protein [bacterium]|nr:lytic transglycosylase domain-containing protein [bacterium]
MWLFLALIFSLQSFALIPIPYSLESQREKELPDFGHQSGALGYKSQETFKVPPELKTRVDFWKRVYTEWTSSQAVLHDSEYPELTYLVLDISPYTESSHISYPKRMAAMNRFFKAEKEKIASQLRQLQTFKETDSSMPVELIALKKKFEPIKEKNKYLNAIKRMRAQVGQRDHIVKGFIYGGRYFNEMMKIFEQRRIPKELTRLPLVESAFNLNAKSKVGASGIWQFMRNTGKQYLRIDKTMDERNDPITATKAAAQLLKENYEALGSWPLAITAYNHGRSGIARAVRSVGSQELHHIIKNHESPTFGFASQNFFSEFLAILEVEREYRKHFGKMLVDPPIENERVLILKASPIVEISNRCGISPKEISYYNPALTDRVIIGKTNIPKGFKLRVPVGNGELCIRPKKSITQNTKTIPAQTMRFHLNSEG